MSGHSWCGGSSIHRIINCAGSAALLATVPPLPDDEYSSAGSTAHELAATCLKSGIHETALVADEYDVETRRAVQTYLDAVYAEMAKSKTVELYVETAFVFKDVGDGKEAWGQNDAIVYHPDLKRLVVFDYKHGVGQLVNVEDNEQLRFYAAGAYMSSKWAVTDLEIVIVQPRSWQDAEPIRRQSLDPLDLINFTGDVAAAVDKAKAPGAPLTPHPAGKGWCFNCDAAAICPARERQALEALTLKYQDITDMDPARLPTTETLANDQVDPGRIGRIIQGIDVLTAWANQVREFAEAHMLAGTMTIPGWKVVDKIGRRKIVAPDNEVVGYAALMFGLDEEDIHPRKLATLTEIEKQLKIAGAKKADIDDFMLRFTVKESSGLTIAPEGDRRPAVNAVEAAFGDVKLSDLEMDKALPGRCEEASPQSHDKYIPCNRPATKMIDVGRREGVLRMCDACADHSVRNRGMICVGDFNPK